MHIESLTLRNFRCFGDEPITISMNPGIMGFVGNNGSGKTAALESLRRLFSPIATERLMKRTDVHFGPNEGIQKLSVSERQIVIDVVFGLRSGAQAAPVFNDLFFSAADNSLKVRLRLECLYSAADALEDDLETKVYAVRTLDPVPFGPDDERKMPLRGRPTQYAELVYIPAHRDSRGVSQIALRNLLQRLERSADWQPETKAKSRAFAEEIQKNLNDTEAMKLATQTLVGFWSTLHDGRYDGEVTLGVVATEFQQLIRALTLRFTKAPGGGERQLEELSEGQTSLLYFALSATLHKLTSDMHKAVPNTLKGFRLPDFPYAPLTIFALEEPENHLSPFYLPRLVTLLEELNLDGSSQAILTSHATSILSRIQPRNVRYFRNSPTTLASTAVPLPLPPEKSEEDKFVQQVILSNPEIYFARVVIIGEGESERLVIPKVAGALGVSLDPSFVAYVSIGGRHAQHLWRLLNGLNIPHLTLLDFDLGRTAGGLGRLRNAISWLTDLGLEYVPTRTTKEGETVHVTVADIPDNSQLSATNYTGWTKALRSRHIFYSAPVDLDMMMLQAFPDEYRPDEPFDAATADLAQVAKNVFKKGPAQKEIASVGLTVSDAELHAYNDLFKSSSKPGSHLLAFTRLSTEKIQKDCPEPLRALITKAGQLISPDDQDDGDSK